MKTLTHIPGIWIHRIFLLFEVEVTVEINLLYIIVVFKRRDELCKRFDPDADYNLDDYSIADVRNILRICY